MKRILLSTVAAAALVASASAADLPRRGPAPAPYAAPFYSFSWTGLYLGAHLGYGFGSDRINEVGVPGATANPSIDGFLAGGYLGANWQFNQIVVGLEGDLEYSGGRGRVAVGAPFTAATAFTTDLNWQGSVRGRFGFAMDRALIYVTGGFAFADMDRTVVDAAITNISSTKAGYTVGGGLEYAFTNNWLGRAEYRYSDFGRVTDLVNGVNYRHQVDQHAVRFGLGYKW